MCRSKFCACLGMRSVDYIKFLLGRVARCSSGSTLKKKKGQTSDQCGSHNHSIGGLAHAKTSGLGPALPQPGLCPLSADQPWQHERHCDLSDPEREATYLPLWRL